MTVPLSTMREMLLPGLMEAMALTQDLWAAEVLNSGIYVPAAPHIWVPRLTLPAAVAAGAAAAIIKNPEITRRFWAGWRL